MKNNLLQKAAIFLTVILLVSCSKEKSPEPVNGNVQFSMSIIKSSELKAAINSPIASHILVSIENPDGTEAYASEKVELIAFGEGYISDPLSLKPGTYKLTKFMVLDNTGNAIYACPKAGSELAYLVKQPLDIEFVIKNSDDTTMVTPEVLSTTVSTPSAFGYFDASFTIVKTIDFLIGVFIYNKVENNLSLTDATIKIYGDSKELYAITSTNGTSKISVNEGYTNYKLEVVKAGYISYSATLSSDSLKSCFNDPIIIILKNSTVDLLTGLVAYYPFNGNANDESGNGNNGIVNGAQLTADRNGKANSAYSFNGNNNYINIGNNPSIKRFQSNHSVAFWVNLKVYSPNYCSIILSNRTKLTSKYSGSMIEIAGELSTEFKRVIFYKNINITDDTLSAGYFSSVKQLNLNTWYFVCLTYEYNGGSNNVVKSYINGELTSTQKVSATIDPETASTYIGCETELYPVDYSLNGSLDEIRIYKRVLDENEINLLYNSK